MKCCKDCVHILENCDCENMEKFEMSKDSPCWGCFYQFKRAKRHPCNKCIDGALYKPTRKARNGEI